jgi:hypothetical protein
VVFDWKVTGDMKVTSELVEPERRLAVRGLLNCWRAEGVNCGVLEHTRATRFHVPKNRFFGTPRLLAARKTQAELCAARSKIGRIRASLGLVRKFQKTALTLLI